MSTNSEERDLDADARAVVSMLATEFSWPCPADTLATLVYSGLKMLHERTLVHLDPQLATAVTCLRHAVDVFVNAPADTLDDVQAAFRAGFNVWLDGDEEEAEDD